ncbi:MAG: alpha-amylase family glycosyl hydrolase, partial [Bacteroidales bacterium]
INYASDPTQATLVLYAPGKMSAFVIGDFSDWTQQNKYQMKRDGDYWWITLTDLTPGKEYGFQYIVNTIGGSPVYTGDPYAEKILHELDRHIPVSTYPELKPYPVGKANGPVSVLQTLQSDYDWQINDFKVKNKGSLTIYELLIRDFTATSDLVGVMEKLDYLQGLGVNAIELMPCQEFSGNDSWGYNPIYYFAMDKAYGTQNMYKAFIDECHRRGIAVLLDVVYNQADQDMPFVKLYFDGNNPSADNPWFNVSAPHPYSVFYDFNHESVHTRNFVKRNLKFLLEEYKFDGFRFDLTKGFTNKPSGESTASAYDESRIRILKDYNNAIRSVNPDAIVILEHFCAFPEERELAMEGMLLWKNMNGAYGQLIKGYSSNISSMYENGNSMPINSLVGYMESHDEERLMYLAKAEGINNIKLSESKRLARAKLCALYSLLVPGPKMIWQFGEMGYDVSINFNGRTGRKPPHWEYLDNDKRKEVVDLYRTLINLRTNYPQLFDGNGIFEWSNATVLSAGSRLMIKHADLTIIAIANFSQSNTSVSPEFPFTGIWHNLVDDIPFEVNSSNQNQVQSLTGNSFRLFTSDKPDFSLDHNQVKEEVSFSLYPNPTSGHVYFNTEVNSVKIISSSGIVLKTLQQVTDINLSSYPNGIYWISIEKEAKWITTPVLKL